MSDLITPEMAEFTRQQMEQAGKEKARQDRLNNFKTGENTKDYAEVLLNEGGLQEMLNTMPEILDNDTAFTLAAKQAQDRYLAKQREQQAQVNTEQPKQPEVQETSQPLTPSTVVPAAQTQPKQEQTIDWGRVTHKELEEKHGLSKGLSRMAAAFPPNKFIEQ